MFCSPIFFSLQMNLSEKKVPTWKYSGRLVTNCSLKTFLNLKDISRGKKENEIKLKSSKVDFFLHSHQTYEVNYLAITK